MELQKIPLLIRPNSLKIQEEEKEGGASERFYQALAEHVCSVYHVCRAPI